MFKPLPDLMTPDRLQHGYVIVLPGIEGRSHWNKNIVRGLIAGGVPYAVEIHDWTYGRLLALYNLVASGRHHQQARLIAGKITRYRDQYGDRPIYIIGHSGGGGMTLLALAQLPDGVKIDGAVLIAPAISRSFDLTSSLPHVSRGIWNISSYGDLFFMGFSALLGNIDRHWQLPAGLTGFSKQVHERVTLHSLPPLLEFPYRWEYLSSRFLGGHFGGTCVPFVQNYISAWIKKPAEMERPSSVFAASTEK